MKTRTLVISTISVLVINILFIQFIMSYVSLRAQNTELEISLATSCEDLDILTEENKELDETVQELNTLLDETLEFSTHMYGILEADPACDMSILKDSDLFD